MKLPATDPYKTLGIQVTATADEIKKRYRTLAMQYHPDRNPGNKEAEEKFKLVAEAYDWLTDPNKKALIDRSRKTQTTGAGDKINMEDLFAQFGSIFGDNTFKDFFGQEQRPRETWAERMKRAKREGDAKKKQTNCPTCEGIGWVLTKVMSAGGVMGFRKINCPTCS